MDNSYPWNGTRCKKGYKVNKKLKRCISTLKSVLKPAPDPIQQIVQIARRGTKCPTSFKYNKSTKMCEKCPDGTRKVGRTCILLPTDDVKTKVVGPIAVPPPIVLPKPPPAYLLYKTNKVNQVIYEII